MSDTKPRRYYLETCACDAEKCNAYLAERDDGEYVEASAYDALEAELAALKKQVVDAPWTYSRDKLLWTGTYLKSYDTHRAKLVNVEKL